MKTTTILGPRREIDWRPCLFQRWFQFGIRATTLIWQAGFFMRLLLRTKRIFHLYLYVIRTKWALIREYVFHFNLLDLFMNNFSINRAQNEKCFISMKWLCTSRIVNIFIYVHVYILSFELCIFFASI